ncbi:MAG TPA: TetR-like C-terminal domain-containing protein [Hyphomicrobiales bacterium]|nr:TetR-like C-terminal domain-containing protein [Kaistiaceae bacterium]HQF31369.1 TetR-like C-terminal domain-containing protein [Hyphomicrobiales bacterium]
MKRPGGRSARVGKAVLDAVIAEVAENGAAGLTVAAVAARSGVHATSIYRRWGSVARLGLEAALAVAEERVPVPDTGSLSGDLAVFLAALEAHVRTPLGGALLVLSTAGDADMAEARTTFWRERLGKARAIFTRAMARGEVAADTDPDEALQFAIAPIYLRALVLQAPADAAFLAQTVEIVGRAFAARGTA